MDVNNLNDEQKIQNPNEQNSSETQEVKTPEIDSETKKPKLTKKRKIILGVLFVAILLAGGLAWYFTQADKTKTADGSSNQEVASNSLDFSLGFRHDSVNDYLIEGDVEWFGLESGLLKTKGGSYRLYTESDGLPPGSVNSVQRYENRLWVSTMNGVSVLDEKTGKFETSMTKLSNGRIFYDSYGNKLFLSTFDGFFEYVKGQWVAVDGPQNATHNLNFAAAKENIVVTTNNETMPVWVLDRSSNQWKQVQPNMVKDGVPTVFVLKDKAFIMGRSAGYTSCDSRGKSVATVIETLDENEAWSSLDSFNSDMNREEITQIDVLTNKDEVKVQTYACEGSSVDEYSLEYDGNTVTLNDKKTIDQNSAFAWQNEAEQQQLVKKINDVTNLPPYMEVLGIQPDSSILIGYTDELSTGTFPIIRKLAILNKGKIDQRTEIKLPKESVYTSIVPIACGKSREVKHMFFGVGEDSEGGPTGEWTETSIYSYENGALSSEPISLNNDVSVPVFACNDTHITWVGKSTVNKLDTTSKQKTSLAMNAGRELNTYDKASPTDDGNLWILAIDQSKQDSNRLYYFDITKNSIKDIGSFNGSNLLGSTNDFVWLSSGFTYGGGEADKTETYRVDQTGKQSAKLTGASVVWAVTFGPESFVLQPKIATDSGVSVPPQISTVSAEGNIKDLSETLPWSYMYSDKRLAVYDSTRNKVWVSDAANGVFGVQLPKSQN